MIQVKFKKLHDDATPFKYTRDGDACMDMFTLEEIILRYGETLIIPTGIAVEIPSGYEGHVRGRSGLSSRGIFVHLGTIDETYRGDVGIIVTNFARETPSSNFKVEKGTRLAQFSIHPIYRINLTETEELSDSIRGINGYGSSGLQ